MRFKPWLLLGHLDTLRPRQNKLQLKEALQLKARWLSSRTVAVLSSETQEHLNLERYYDVLDLLSHFRSKRMSYRDVLATSPVRSMFAPSEFPLL